MLLKKGADGGRQDRDGETPFLNASDSCKKALHDFGFAGDMSTTNEAKDKMFVENLDDAGGLEDSAKTAMNDRKGALKKEEKDEKSGMLSVKLEKIGTELSIYVQKGRYLKDCDMYGGNDVYVVCSVGTEDAAHPEIPADMEHQRTSVMKDAGPDPTWDQGRGEKLTFEDIGSDFEDILFRCYDEDMGGEMNHDLIGMHKIPLSKIKQLRGDGTEDWDWEADVQLRTNKLEEQNLPPQTSDKYRTDLDEDGNPLAGAIEST